MVSYLSSWRAMHSSMLQWQTNHRVCQLRQQLLRLQHHTALRYEKARYSIHCTTTVTTPGMILCQRIDRNTLVKPPRLAAKVHNQAAYKGALGWQQGGKLGARGLPACFNSSEEAPCELERPFMMKKTIRGVQNIAP